MEALLADPNDDFRVTILSRPSSTKTFLESSRIKLVKANFDNIDELINVFTGHDAVVHASAIPGIPSHPLMIEAAANAGVKRFILNEFANSYDQPGLPELERFRTPKRNILGIAQQTATESDGAFSWSGLATGNFLDYALLKYPQIGIDIRNRSARLVDGGIEPFTAVVLKDIGLAVRGILRKPEETRNKMCHVRSVETCQKEIMKACERAIGEQFEVENVDGEKLYVEGKEAFNRGERSGMVNILVVQLFQKGRGRSIVAQSDKSDNVLLGVKEKSIDDVVHYVLEKLSETA